ncbi:prenyltransferase [Halanaerobacter jeridensis]|uniref:1,4-dihydroxy-2-naphthoate octaprenyltransferase n=1 Tax=Halanaerobacter jeridensis TaxID=706427 RepID=A0A938XTR3_9FIRM|nr:prenyltransferase [Halanaerobacter jeridensis]MBM7556151.1 1,4-dihydroxy-2-naphthoate octaprenyltransferase [Halanaerobacter jeridensis]
MDRIKVWITAFRPFSFTATIIPVLLGTVLAVVDLGRVNYYSFLVVLIGVLLLHSGTNLINDYYDYRNGVDSKEYPGGSGFVPGDIILAYQLRVAALICFSLSFLLALYLIYQQGLVIALIFGIGIAGGYFYTAGPINYKYYALGVPGVFILLGPILVGISYYVQTASYNNRVFLVSLPVALLVSAILHSNDLRDMEHDSEVGINTLANILDRKLAGQLYFWLLGLAYFLICYLILRGVLPLWALITLITVPQAAENVAIIIFSQENRRSKVEELERKTANLHFKFGLLLVLSLLSSNLLS